MVTLENRLPSIPKRQVERQNFKATAGAAARSVHTLNMGATPLSFKKSVQVTRFVCDRTYISMFKSERKTVGFYPCFVLCISVAGIHAKIYQVCPITQPQLYNKDGN